jgi:hypothetical protein
MAAYKILDFSDIINAVREELKIQSSDTVSIARIKRDINIVYINEVVPFSRWKWLEGFTTVAVPQVYADGTFAATQNSATITLSTAPSVSLGSFKNKNFSPEGQNEIYKISAHTAGSATVTLDRGYNNSTTSAVAFKIWSDNVALPTDCRETVEVWHDFSRDPMEGRGLQEFRKIQNQAPKSQARPYFYYTGDYVDPSVDSGETESDRYRALWVHPSVYMGITNVHVSYVKEVEPLEDDGDEPVIPVEDRIVLVYGALARAWRRERNEADSITNERLFKEKLSRMVGKIEDSFDKPSFSPESIYIASKRASRGGNGSGRIALGGGSSGGSAATVTYLQDVTINRATITGNVTVNSGITIDGRDISADGTTLETVVAGLADHIADTSDAHDASAISNVPSGNLDATDVQSALDELQDDVDTRALDSDLDAHIADTTGAHAASAISNTPSGNLAATDVQTALDELQSDVDDRVLLTAVGAANGVASLDAGGKVPSSQLPALALVDVSVVADEAAQLALVAEEGDVAVRTDSEATYIHNGGSAGTMSDWQEITTPTAASLATHISNETGVHGATSANTASKIVARDGSGNFSAGTITATLSGNATNVTGTVAIANGGTGQTAKTAAFDALSPATTKGDIIVFNGTDNIRLPVGADGQVLAADSSETSGLIWTDAASGTASSASNVLSNLALSASVSANALTVALKTKAGSDPSVGDEVTIGFRNATLTTGTYVERTVNSALSVTVSSGSTLGLISNQNQYIYVYAIDNAGTVELAVSGQSTFDEGTVVSTTAEGGAGAADSVSVMYSTTARSNVAVRLIGRVQSNQATTGTYASSPTEVSLVPFGRKTLRHSVEVATANGYGSTANKILRWTNANVVEGTAISYADSATAGGTFTILQDGVYTAGFTFDCASSGRTQMGISRNANGTDVTTSITSVAAPTRLTFAKSQNVVSDDAALFVSWTGILRAGDVIRAHTAGDTPNNSNQCQFHITKVGD